MPKFRSKTFSAVGLEPGRECPVASPSQRSNPLVHNAPLVGCGDSSGGRGLSGYSARLTIEWSCVQSQGRAISELSFTQLRQCFSEETQKAVGPFYLRGSKSSHTEGTCVTCRGLHNSEISYSCVSPRMGCLEYTYIFRKPLPQSICHTDVFNL